MGRNTRKVSIFRSFWRVCCLAIFSSVLCFVMSLHPVYSVEQRPSCGAAGSYNATSYVDSVSQCELCPIGSYNLTSFANNSYCQTCYGYNSTNPYTVGTGSPGFTSYCTTCPNNRGVSTYESASWVSLVTSGMDFATMSCSSRYNADADCDIGAVAGLCEITACNTGYTLKTGLDTTIDGSAAYAIHFNAANYDDYCYSSVASGMNNSLVLDQLCTSSIYYNENFQGLDYNIWRVFFPYGTVRGESICSTSSSGTTPASTDGQYCWCRANGYKPNGGELFVTKGSPWKRLTNSYSNYDDCFNDCSVQCALAVKSDSGARAQMFKKLDTVCEPHECTITLDANGGTSGLPSVLYTKYELGAYRSSSDRANETNLMTTITNGLNLSPYSLPTGATLTADFNLNAPQDPENNNALYTINTISNRTGNRAFEGFSDVQVPNSSNHEVIDANGFITSDGGQIAEGLYKSETPAPVGNGGGDNKTGENVCPETTWYAQWGCANIASLPTPSPVPSGYHFDGWYKNANGIGTKYTTSICLSADTTLYANWVRNTATVTYGCGFHGGSNVSGSVTSSPQILTGDQTFNMLTSATGCSVPTGYHFNGWSCDHNLGTGATIADNNNENYEYNLVSSVVNNETIYSIQNGTNVYYNGGDGVSIGCNAEWKANDDTTYIVYRYKKDTNASVYTQYGSAQTLTGTTDSSINLNTLATNLAITGYRFVGGFAGTSTQGTAPSGSAVATTTILGDGTRVIDLYYEQNVYYPITFNPNGGTLSGAQVLYATPGDANLYTDATGTTVGVLPTSSFASSFEGWYTRAGGGDRIYNPSGVLTSQTVAGYVSNSQWITTEAQTLYAQEKGHSRSYKLTINRNGGSGNVTVRYRTNETMSDNSANNSFDVTGLYYGDNVTMPAFGAPDNTLTLTGYGFRNWECEDSNSNSIVLDANNTFVMPSSNDVTCTAQWAPIAHTITVNRDGGNGAIVVNNGGTAETVSANGTTFTCNEGDTVTFPGWGVDNSLTKTGYVFTGWNEGNTALNAGISCDADRTITAQWAQCTCTDGSHSTCDGTASVSNNTCSYDFTCDTHYNYNNASGGTVPASAAGVGPVQAPDCSPITHTITVDKNEGSGNLTVAGQTETGSTSVVVTCNEGDTISLPSWGGSTNAITKTGYDFASWNNENNEALNGSVSCNADRTVTAHWSPQEWTITFNAPNTGMPSPSGPIVFYTRYDDGAYLTATDRANHANRMETDANWFVGHTEQGTITYHENTPINPETNTVYPASDVENWNDILDLPDWVRLANYRYDSYNSFDVPTLLSNYNLVQYISQGGIDFAKSLTHNYTNRGVWYTQYRLVAEGIVPRLVGYNFGGWYADANATGSQITGLNQRDDMNPVVYAHWTPKHYNVMYNAGSYGSFANNATSYTDSYDAQNDSGGATYDLPYAIPAAATLAVVDSGYEFLGWSTTPNATVPDWDGEPNYWKRTPNNDTLQVYAVYRKYYTITVNRDGGNGAIVVNNGGTSEIVSANSTTFTCNEGDTVTFPGWTYLDIMQPIPANRLTKADNVFTGWDIPSFTCNANRTITAQWGECGCTAVGSHVASCSANNPSVVNNTCDYNFVCDTGYNYNGASGGPATASAGNPNVTAGSCSLTTHTITFKTGSTVMGTQTCNEGDAVTLNNVSGMSNIPVSDTYGWSFLGWATQSGTTARAYENADTNYVCDADRTLYGVWGRMLSFTSYFSANNTGTGTASPSQRYYNSTDSSAGVNAITTPTIINNFSSSVQGWNSIGWGYNDNFMSVVGVQQSFAPGISDQPNFVAIYERSPQIAYDGNGNTGGSRSNTPCPGPQRHITNGATEEVLGCILGNNGFIKDDYNFDTWYTNAAGTGGTSYAEGASYTFPNNTWTSSNTATLYAKWQKNNYDITYDCNGGTVVGSNTTPVETSVTRTDAAQYYPSSTYSFETVGSVCEREYYTPQSWNCSYTDSNNTSHTVTTGDTVQPYNVTCLAVWDTGQIYLRWEPNNGETIETPNMCTWGGSMTGIQHPTKTGYTFTGWYLKRCLIPSTDVDNPGNALAAKRLNGGSDDTYGGATAATYGITEPGEWGVSWSNGDKVTGVALCSAHSGDNHSSQWGGDSSDWTSDETTLTSASGETRYCWCKATHYTANNAQQCSLSAPAWVFNLGIVSDAYCALNCAVNCASKCRHDSVFQVALFGENVASP